MRGPTLKVYFGFGSTWTTADASITWTEVTSKVVMDRGCQISRGRSTELEDYRTGTCSFTLDNRSRLFDPSYTGSRTPFTFTAAQLLPGLPVKVEAVANSTTIPVFRGFITGLPQEYPEQSDSTAFVPITAVDGSAKLANAGTPSSVYAVEVAADSPRAWWRLAETAGSVMGDSSGNDYDGSWKNDAVTLTGKHPNVWEAVPAIHFDGVDRPGFLSTANGILAGRPFSVDFIFRLPSVDKQEDAIVTTLFRIEDAASDSSTRVQIQVYNSATAVWFLSAYFNDEVSTQTLVTTDERPIDGLVYHVGYRCPSAGAAALYLNGVDTSDTVDDLNLAFAEVTSDYVVVGSSSPDSTEGRGQKGPIADVAIYNADIGASRIAAHAAAVSAPWDGDTTGERIARVLDLVGWPADLRDIATGLTTLGPAVLAAKAGALVKGFEKAEQGRLFIARDGSFTFFDRYHYLTVTEGSTVQATFSDDGSDIPYRGFSYAYDTRLVYNRIRGSRVGGAVIEEFDQTSIDTYEEQVDASLEGLQVGTDAEVRALCELRLLRYKDPQLRAEPIRVALHGITAAQQATVLGLELGYRVNVERTPNDTGSAIDQDTLVEGIAHSIGPGRWDTTVTTSPVDATAYGIWGTGLWGTAEWAA